MPFSDLDEHIKQYAAAAIRIQEIYDEAWCLELEVSKIMIASSAADFHDLLRPLIPSRQLLKEYEFTFSAAVAVNDLQGFKLQLLPLNLSYSVTRQVQRQNHSRFRISVEQIPIQE